MSIQTHYTTLGLLHNAHLQVIEAAYEALALVHHPDRNATRDGNLSQRVAHATAFHAVQDAYAVLSDSNSKAAYDTQLQQQKATAETVRSPAENTPGSHSQGQGSDLSQRPTVLATTPEGRIALRMSMQRQFAKMKESRAERSQADALMDMTALRFTVKCWLELAEEQKGDPMNAAYCKLQALEYEEKLRVREAEQDVSSEHRSEGNTGTRDQDPRAKTPTNTRRRATTKAEERDQAEKIKAEEYTDKARSRAEAKTLREELKKSRHEAKVAAARGAREKHQRRMDEAAARKAEHIAEARAKAAPANKASNPATVSSIDRVTQLSEPQQEACTPGVGHSFGKDLVATKTTSCDPKVDNEEHERDSSEEHATQSDKASHEANLRPSVKKPCRNCDNPHASLTEWKRCNIIPAKIQPINRAFLTVI